MVLRILRAGLITGVIDALFSSVLVSVFYGSTVTRLWQGVASTVFGKGALEKPSMAVVGLLMHFGVALAWSAVFALIVMRSAVVRRMVATPGGVIAVAFVYGPLIWLVMSLIVIPLLTHRPPTIGFRWFVQLAGHVPFVALPIVALLSRDH
jgi:hypothetical protein